MGEKINKFSIHAFNKMSSASSIICYAVYYCFFLAKWQLEYRNLSHFVESEMNWITEHDATY